MNSQEKNKFLGMLYDILIDEGIIKYEDKPKDLKEKKERLEKYLVKLERVQDKSLDNDRYLNMIKKLYYDRYIIKESDIPDKYFESLQQQYLDQGHGHVNLVNPENDRDRNLRNEHIKTVIREQKDSLDNWLNYFLSEDSSYLEMWAKVWAFQGMLHIGNINKNKDGYDRRSKTTINPFVSFDSEILGKCVELVKESFDKKELTDEEIKKLVSSGSFTKLYGKLLANKKQIKAETTEGIWVKYNRETNQSIEEKLKSGQEPEYIRLYNSLQGYNTGWCTAGARDAGKTQILGGDFYVYYSKDKEGKFTIPRLAIRMEGNSIGEIRGIASDQNIESNMEEILEEKLKEFPDRDEYKKRVNDMKNLTIIYNKHLKNEELSKEDLIFVYEIYNKIDGFGYKKDPRIEEIIDARNEKEDLAYVFDCSEEEISYRDYGEYSYSTYQRIKKIKYLIGNFALTMYGVNDELNFDDNDDDDELDYEYEIPKVYHLIVGWFDEILNLPENIIGDLIIGRIGNVDKIVFPKSIAGNCDLSYLDNGINLSETIIFGDLNLRSLLNGKGIRMPKEIGGNLFLNSLTNLYNLELPEKVGGKIYVYRNFYTLEEVFELQKQEQLKNKPKDISPPEDVSVDLDLRNLTSAEGLVLDKIINGNLFLNNLKDITEIDFPEYIKGSLYLNSIKTANGVLLPEKIDGSLVLSSLIDGKGLGMPEIIGGNLDLSNLYYLYNLELPEKVGGKIYIYGGEYTLWQVKEMQSQEREKIKNNSKKLERVKQDGFISNTVILINIILFGVLCFILTLLIIK